MQKIMRFFSTMIILLLIFSAQVSAQESRIDINNLIEKAKEYDNRIVTVKGEAVGELLERGDYCWVNIHDGTNAIGIWIKSADAKQIKKYGDYKNKGDIIQVTGTFRRACAEHGGEADIHNQAMKIMEKGHSVKEDFSNVKTIAAIVLLVLLAASIFIIHKFKIVKLPFKL